MTLNETENPSGGTPPQGEGSDLPSFGELFNFGWGVTKANFGILIGTIIFVYVVAIIGDVLSSNITESGSTAAGLGMRLIFWAVQVFLGIGFYRIALALVDGKRQVLVCYSPAVTYLFRRSLPTSFS